MYSYGFFRSFVFSPKERKNTRIKEFPALIIHKVDGGVAIGIYSHADPVGREAIREFVVDVSPAFGRKPKHSPWRADISSYIETSVGPPRAIAKKVDLDNEGDIFGFVVRQVHHLFIEAGH